MTNALIEHWPVWLVTATLIYAAYIDGKLLKVPHWITYPMMAAGLIYNGCVGGTEGLWFSFVGLCVGLATLLPLWAIGGMGGGDVKLMAGIGAWVGATVTWEAFCVSAVVGAVMAVVMVVQSGRLSHHFAQGRMLLTEMMMVKDPGELSRRAKKRKPTMTLLPYGIPICIGTITHFASAGMLW